MAVRHPAFVGPHPGLIDWLAGRRVEYELREHPETFTAEATARAEHIDPRRFAKVVGVTADDGRRVAPRGGRAGPRRPGQGAPAARRHATSAC